MSDEDYLGAGPEEALEVNTDAEEIFPMSETEETNTYWYESAVEYRYLLQVKERENGWYFRKVTPLVSQDDRGYYRVREWKRMADEMVSAFREDHTERDAPDDWENARTEEA